MKFSSSILSSLVLASSALAAPGTALRRSRAADKSNPINRINKPELTNVTEVSYSSNWAGAVLIGTGYTSVTGTFTVPSPTTAGSGVCLFTSTFFNFLANPNICSPKRINRHTTESKIPEHIIDSSPSPPGLVSTAIPAVPPSSKQVLTGLVPAQRSPTMLGMSGTQTTRTTSRASPSLLEMLSPLR